MKLSAHTLAKLQRTLGVLIVSMSSAIAQTPSTPAPIAPATIDPPTAPALPADASKAAGTVTPASIESPLQTPAAGGVAAPDQPLPPGALPPNDPNAPKVSEFQGDEISLVIRSLARQAGMNVVVSPQVTGLITLRVEGKPPADVIRIICQANGLIIDELEGVSYIKTQAEKAKEPTESRQYTFSYAVADKAAGLLQTQLTSGVAPQVDTRTNTIFYRETKSNLDKIHQFLESIDRPTQQVMIEARLVEVTANPKQSYGINWAGVVGSSSSPQTIKYGGSNFSGDNLPTSTPQAGTGGSIPLKDFVRNGELGPNFADALGGQFAILSLPQLSVTLRMLNEDSDAEFLANPRIVAANNQKAEIKIIRNQPVPQLNFNEQTAQAVFGGFQDKEFGNTLSVTPSINKDNFITLQVKPEISNKVGDATFVFGGASVASPIIDKRTFDSNVLIKSGDILAIGGLLQDETTKARTKVPIAGDIPLFGRLFQEKVSQRTKRNLLVFVTPTVIKQGYGTGLEGQVSGLSNSGEEYADPNGWRNNAKGAVRLSPASNRQVVADYPKPGIPPVPKKIAGSKYKVSAQARE